jgi:acyl-CoA thioesterase FadM
MSAWIETCRSTVAPWECDVTEHFTIAYYFDRLEQATANLTDVLGIAEPLRAGALPRRFHVRFARELRAGASFHIDSAALAGGDGSGLCLGHRILDSANGETVTWVEEHWGAPLPAALASPLAQWDGPAVEPRPEPGADARFLPTAHGRVRPADLDENGVFSLAGLVHHLTDACIQAMTAIGFDGEYMETQRRGYSTFELALTLAGALRSGDPYRVETTIAHLGSSSVRLVHRLLHPGTGAEIARLGQFGVQLDLDARRPAPLPEPIRTRAAHLFAAPG